MEREKNIDKVERKKKEKRMEEEKLETNYSGGSGENGGKKRT